MILHRHKRLIMGGGVCLLIALTGVVATASVATTQHADTSTSDTAIMAISTTATMDVATETIDVATPTTAEPKEVITASLSTASQEVTSEPSEDEDTTSQVESVPSWDGPVLNPFAGIIQGPSGSETYYNLDMSGVISIMKSLGYDYDYWIRDDGVKMYGDYVMCAADLSIRPKGTILETSLGPGMVCDTGGFVSLDSTRLDIAVNW